MQYDIIVLYYYSKIKHKTVLYVHMHKYVFLKESRFEEKEIVYKVENTFIKWISELKLC